MHFQKLKYADRAREFASRFFKYISHTYMYLACTVLSFAAPLSIASGAHADTDTKNPANVAQGRTSTCPIDVSVAQAVPRTGGRKGPQKGGSVEEVYLYAKKRDHFVVFAKDVEKYLLKTVEEDFCSKKGGCAPVSVEIVFYELKMTARTQFEIDHGRFLLKDVTGAYADIDVDRTQRSVKAKIIWNPRRMLRDQLIINGWKFEHETQLRPVLHHDLRLFAAKRSYTLLRLVAKLPKGLSVEDTNAEHRRLEIEALRGTVPDDMYGLEFSSDRTRPRNWHEDAFPGAIRWLIRDSLNGYTTIVRRVILQTFNDKTSHPIISSILDIKSGNPRYLYRPVLWSDGLEPLE